MATVAKYAKETFWAVAAKGAAFFFYYGVVYYLTHTMTVGVSRSSQCYPPHI